MFSDDPQRQAMMMLAAGLLSPVRNKGGAGFAEAMAQGIQGGLLGYNQARAGVDRKAEMEMRRQFQQRQLEEMDRAAGDNAFMRQAAGQFFKPGNAPADGMGPAMPPSFDPAGFGAALASRGMVREAAPFLPKPEEPVKPMVVGKSLVNPKTGQPIYREPDEPKDWQNPEYIKAQQAIRAAGRPNITTNVMPPKEVFKDSLGLKKDFDGQPEVKGFKEVQGAWDQISTALQKPSPANDMAAATKFMKLLDPGSVVRESELMMAMQASGALDRFMNTADRVLKGHKLTPEQRKDFYTSGEALYNASKDRFSQTVQQYEGIAEQYGLDKRFIENAKPRQSSGKWSIQRVQ